MSELGYIESVRHTYPPFEWVRSEWRGGVFAKVSLELARECRWRFGKTHLTLGPFRLRVLDFDLGTQELTCIRESSEQEERLRARLLLVRDVALSFLRNTVSSAKQLVTK